MKNYIKRFTEKNEFVDSKKIREIESDIVNVVRDFNKKISSEVDRIFIEGLKNKGFKFNSTQEARSFIENNCTRLDDHIFKETTLTVKINLKFG